MSSRRKFEASWLPPMKIVSQGAVRMPGVIKGGVTRVVLSEVAHGLVFIGAGHVAHVVGVADRLEVAGAEDDVDFAAGGLLEPGDFFVEEVQPPVNAPCGDDLQMTTCEGLRSFFV